MKRIRSMGMLAAALTMAIVLVVSGCTKSTTSITTTSTTTTSAATTTVATSTTTAKPTTSTPVTPVKVGVDMAMTGTAGTYKDAVEAIKWQVDLINKAGGIKSLGGAPIELTIADDQSDATIAASAAERLITQNGVVAIVGPSLSADTVTAAQVAQRYKVPMITMSGMSPEILGVGNPYIRVIQQSTEQTAAMTNQFFAYAAKNLGMPTDKVAVAYKDDSYGTSMGPPATKWMRDQGYTVVAEEKFASNITDATPLVLKLKAAGATTVYFVAQGAIAVFFFKALYAQDYHPFVIGGSSAIYYPTYATMLEPAVLAATLNSPNVMGLNPGMVDANMPTFKTWATAWDASHPDIPVAKSNYTILGAQAILALKRALEAAGSRDPVKINDALGKVQIPAGDPDLIAPFLANGLAWNADGSQKNTITAMCQWFDGKISTVWPPEVAVRPPKLAK